MKLNLKFILFAVILIAALAVFAAASKFAGFAGNIYEFENPTKSEIIGQFKQIILKDEAVPIKTNSDGTTNILLMGVAGPGRIGENLTDTIMIVTIPPDRKSVAVSSIPRDLYVESPNKQYWSKINSLYAYSGKENPMQGVKALAGKVKEISGLPVNYYFLVNFEGFKKLVDEVGGIDYSLEKDLYDPLFPNDSFGYEPLYLKAGDYHLDGSMALKLARSRHTVQGDFSRIDRQHKIIKALAEKLESQKIWNNFFAVNNILNIVSKNIKTNITLPEIQKMNDIAKNIPADSITSRIPDVGIANGILYAAKINGADVLLPKDPTYEELKAFYQGKEFAEREKPSEKQINTDSEANNSGAETQTLMPSPLEESAIPQDQIGSTNTIEPSITITPNASPYALPVGSNPIIENQNY